MVIHRRPFYLATDLRTVAESMIVKRRARSQITTRTTYGINYGNRRYPMKLPPTTRARKYPSIGRRSRGDGSQN